MADTWQAKWKVLQESFGKGGQGFTKLVQKKDGDQKGVLKLLHNQKDPERRARLRREATALETLRHKGIALYLDSNSEHYDNLAIPLYLVTDYIEGPTLTEQIESSPMELTDAIALILPILEALDYCHTEGFIHRDIKPHNVILRRGQITDPVLIDFGLSFTELEEADVLSTDSGQQLGNRFIILPEMAGASLEKRDRLSDITQVVGLLFFVLTGKHPGHLTDQNEQKPHERPHAQQVFSAIDGQQLRLLNRVFSIGFKHRLADRWTSIQELRDSLIRIKSGDLGRVALEDALDNMRTTLESDPSYIADKQIAHVFTCSMEAIVELRTTINERLNPLVSASERGARSADRATFGISFRFDRHDHSNMSRTIDFRGQRDGEEYKIEATLNPPIKRGSSTAPTMGAQTIELIRVALNDPDPKSVIKDKLTSYVTSVSPTMFSNANSVGS